MIRRLLETEARMITVFLLWEACEGIMEGYMCIWMIGLAAPVLLHVLATEFVAAVFGGVLDPSSRVLLVSVLVIPPALYMCRNDEAGRKKTADPMGSDRTARGRSAGKDSLLCVLCFVLGGLLNLGWSGFLSLLKIQRYFSNAAQEALLSSLLPIQILAMGIFAPLTEELIFRVLVYRRMKRKLSAGVSVFLSSLLFAVYHGNVIQMVFAFPMALVLTLLYEKGGRFRYPLLFHMGCNLTAVAVNLFT